MRKKFEIQCNQRLKIMKINLFQNNSKKKMKLHKTSNATKATE